MLLRRPAPAEAAAAAATAAAEEHVRSTSRSTNSTSSSLISNSRINLMLLHAPQLQRLKLQAPISVGTSTTSQSQTGSASAAQTHNHTGSPQSARSTDSGHSSFNCGSYADCVQVRCGLVGRVSRDSAPGSPSCSPKHWTPGQVQTLLLQLLPLRSGRHNGSSRKGSNNFASGTRSRSRGGGGNSPINNNNSGAGSTAASDVIQAQRALHCLHSMLAHTRSNEHNHASDQLLEAFSCVDAEPAVVAVLIGLLDDVRLIDPATSLDTFGEAAASVLSALTAHESSIPNRDILGRPELGLPAALAKQLSPQKTAAEEVQIGYRSRMHTEAARIVRNLTAYQHSCNQTVLGRIEGVFSGLATLLSETSAGEGRMVAAEALFNVMFDHEDNIVCAGKAQGLLLGLAGLLNIDPEHRMAPKHANRYKLAASKVLYLLVAGQSSLNAGIMQYDSLAIPSSLEDTAADSAATAELKALAQAILAQLNCSKC